MSGGYFHYDQWRINDIASLIDVLINTNDSKELNEWGEPIGRNFDPAVIERFKEAVEVLCKAFVYAHEIDYLLSGDTGPETFLERCKQKLDK